ncbi:hypothetical protein HK405_007697 [Cladochytrium tenue]|nr:hypothetical protein HK405_007697 [Cladochytrium tenue]
MNRTRRVGDAAFAIAAAAPAGEQFRLVRAVFVGDSDGATWALVRLIADGEALPSRTPAAVDATVAGAAPPPAAVTCCYASLCDVRPAERIGVALVRAPGKGAGCRVAVFIPTSAPAQPSSLQSDPPSTATCVVVDLADALSLRSVAAWLELVDPNHTTAQYVVGVVPDQDPRAVSVDNAERCASAIGAKYIEIRPGTASSARRCFYPVVLDALYRSLADEPHWPDRRGVHSPPLQNTALAPLVERVRRLGRPHMGSSGSGKEKSEYAYLPADF